MPALSLAWMFCILSLSSVILRTLVDAASCPNLTPTNSIQPTVASGYQLALVATGLTSPRSLEFDSAGNLLVVQKGVGIINLVLTDGGGSCLSVKSSKNVVQNSGVSYGSLVSPELRLTLSLTAQSRSCSIRRWQDALRVYD